MKRILLTGATGFLGSHLLEALLREGAQVTILKRSTSDTWRIKHLLSEVTTFDIDIQPLEDAFRTQILDAVIHTACRYGRNSEPAHLVAETNLLFPLRVLDAATTFKAGPFLNTDTFFNTGTVPPTYLNAYSLAKRQFVEWLRQRSTQIQVINLKLQHIYGPNDHKEKFVPWLIDQLQAGTERIPLTIGDQLRDFIYVDDVVAAYLLILKKSAQLRQLSELDVGTGKPTSVRTFIQTAATLYKEIDPDAKSSLGFGDVPLQPGELMDVTVNNTPLKQLGWEIRTTLEAGIGQTIAAQLRHHK